LSLRTATQEQSATGVLLIDLNRFKPVNDRFGHLAGDHVLQSVAARLSASVRAHDVAARFGGDEFGVVLAPGTGPATAERLIFRIQNALEQPMLYKGHAINVGISIGAGMYPADGSTAAELVAAADARMYGMKRRRLTA
jgi:diguanylate cyclase (GGDEF)-like protein